MGKRSTSTTIQSPARKHGHVSVARRITVIAALGLFICLPFTANANAGTPLMWASAIHLVIGNALIGLLEGLAVAIVFKRPKLPAVALMIAANYLSAWVGGLLIATNWATHLDWHLYNAWGLLWQFVFITFAVTLVLEWPFVALCFCRQANWLRRSLLAVLAVQTVSYLLLFGWYWGASGKSLYTRMNIVPPDQIQLPSDVRLIFLGAEDGRVYEYDPTGRTVTRIGEVASTNKNDRLIWRETTNNAATFALTLRRAGFKSDEASYDCIPGIEATAAQLPQDDGDREDDLWFSIGPDRKFTGAPTNEWSCQAGFWAVEGMLVENASTGEEYHFSWETPFSQWHVRTPIQAPGGIFVFQLGEDQLCGLDPVTKRIALLARGRGHTLMLKKPRRRIVLQNSLTPSATTP